MGERLESLKLLINSPKGKNIISFLTFLVISAILWIVLALNEEAQRDIRCHLSIVNVPDSITQITPMPESFNVNVQSRGSSMLKYVFRNNVNMKIDYRNYESNNCIQFSDVALKAFFRNRLGANVQVNSVTPDSIRLLFTSTPGFKVPVRVDAHVVPGPQFAIIGKIRSLTDSVTLYSIDPSLTKVKYVSTAPVVLNDVRSSQSIKTRILTPAHVRAIPDSVEVHIDVEPLVAKHRKVSISAQNVPYGYRLISVPNEVDVYYMVPMSIYKSADSNPNFVVSVDYKTIEEGDTKIAVSLKSAPKDFLNVYVDVDSVDFILEKRE